MQDFDEWADPALYLPVRGHLIRIPSPTAREGLRLRRLMLGDALTPDRERVETRRILRDALDALDAAGADETAAAIVGRCALIHFGQSPEAAAAYWRGDLGGGIPPAGPPAPAAAAPTDSSAPGFLGPDDPGGGPIGPGGVRWWFNPPEMAPNRAPGAQTGPRISWRDILACWPDIELDLQDRGIDLDSGVLDERPWRWLELRIRALATTRGTRLNRSIFPPKKT